MKNFFRNSGLSDKLKGNGYWILNVLRVGNIIALLSVMAACMVMMAFSIINRKAWGFDIMSYAMIFLFTSFLIYSETGLSKKYFARNWPILSAEHHGFGWLGLFLIFLGVFVLGNLNEDAFLQENIPMSIWRLILAAGILSMTFGIVAIISTWIFGDSQAHITARAVREKGSLATGGGYENDAYSQASFPSNYYPPEKPQDEPETTASKWAGKAKRLTSHFTRGDRPFISRPRPQSPPPVPDIDQRSTHSETTVYDRQQRTSPIVPDMPRPPTARHPMFDRSSTYSEASHLPRFYGDRGRNQI
jgi:hypothetical protein